MTKFYISISNEQDKIPINELKLEEVSCTMLKYLTANEQVLSLTKLSPYNLNTINLCLDILICNDSKIRELNKEYRGKDKATDVLSFALFADSTENQIILNNQIFLGEIIISADTAKKQADENKKTFEEELYFLLSHGILHLFGVDHPDEKTLEYMIKIQNEMVSGI